jgi:hypothetical protein
VSANLRKYEDRQRERKLSERAIRDITFYGEASSFYGEASNSSVSSTKSDIGMQLLATKHEYYL